MSSNMHFKQFACGFAMFESESDDEATDGWSATFSEMRNDERMEEIEGEEGSAVEVEGAAQFLELHEDDRRTEKQVNRTS